MYDRGSKLKLESIGDVALLCCPMRIIQTLSIWISLMEADLVSGMLVFRSLLLAPLDHEKCIYQAIRIIHRGCKNIVPIIVYKTTMKVKRGRPLAQKCLDCWRSEKKFGSKTVSCWHRLNDPPPLFGWGRAREGVVIDVRADNLCVRVKSFIKSFNNRR